MLELRIRRITRIVKKSQRTSSIPPSPTTTCTHSPQPYRFTHTQPPLYPQSSTRLIFPHKCSLPFATLTTPTLPSNTFPHILPPIPYPSDPLPKKPTLPPLLPIQILFPISLNSPTPLPPLPYTHLPSSNAHLPLRLRGAI